MPREAFPLVLEDVTQFTRSLRHQVPGDIPHQTMLNHVARAAGYRNFQHLKAASGWGEAPTEAPPNLAQVRRAAARFDAEGRFTGWPTKRSLRMLCLWPIWARLDPRGVRTERQISDEIHALCTFRDAAGIRREMVGEGMLTRTRDGSEYRRINRAPTSTQRALIRLVLP
ncbi:hypothetical protein JANAI62_22620 [Jannaschia pagri]|uniref:DUF2087 domain-containing protein n=1 Tax=Jannaschia pagri TaxID=2829797 RepID=A0ABQ4NN21_9RHOB|nr:MULTISPECIES: DUF2087 domain-containing protein [unclassified Jannaschia]GIT91805.1 hypothetical protein JANAI61_22630 [Jannaschia sp. AI_61]GIT95639.1 hypothetical protein JANAI62_22620 [Jannaschia sp. AI_62]